MTVRHNTRIASVDGPENNVWHALAGLSAPEWVADALCAQTGISDDVWFPDKGGSTRLAKAVCARCTVTAECLTFALERHERHGIWGGLSDRERRPLETPLSA